MKKLCFFMLMLFASAIITNAQTKAPESNIFIYDMSETYYNTANFDQQNKIETGWFAKYGKIAPKYMKLSQYTTTLSGFTISYKGKDAGVVFTNIIKIEGNEHNKEFLGVYNGQAKYYVQINETTNTKNSNGAVKVKYIDIVNNKTYTKDFTEEYFNHDNYFISLMNELGDSWFSYATVPDAGLKFDKVFDLDQSKKLFGQILNDDPVGDIYRYQYNGTIYGYAVKVFNDDKYDYIIAGADKKITVRTGFQGDNLKTISFTTLTDSKKQTIKLPETTYSYMGYIMDFLGKSGYLK